MTRNHISKLAVAVIFSLSATHQVAMADVDPKKIFYSYSSGSAGTYDTSQGRYWHGGSFTGRVQQTNTDIVRFSPPSINAGCNGIDIFAGSFGMVSGDELVQVARGAAQGAALYFFNLAMSSVCPSCKEVMDNISKKIEELNQWGRNSCENFASAIENSDAGKAMKNNLKSNGSVINAAAGNANAWFDSLGDWAPNTSAGGVSATTAKLMINQNLVYGSLKGTYSNLTFSSLGVAGLVDSAELIQSLFGTIITQATEGTTCTNQKTSGQECITTDNQPATLKLESFVFGIPSGGGKDDGNLLKCTSSASSDPDCVKISAIPLGSSFKGLLSVYQGYLKGSNGVFAKIQRKEIFNNIEQVKFMNSYRYPWVKMATLFKGEAADGLADIIALNVAEAQVRDIGVAMRGVMAYAILAAQEDNKVLLKDQATQLLKIFDKRLEALNTKIDSYKKDYLSNLEVFTANKMLNDISSGEGY